MRFTIEVDYDADPGEDVGAVARFLAADLITLDGVRRVDVHGEEATVIVRPGFTAVTITKDEELRG